MAWKYKLSFLFLLICLSSVNSQVKNARDAFDGEIPYQVSIKRVRLRRFGWNSKFNFLEIQNNYEGPYCGGSLLNKRWAMSAAHCFDIEDHFLDEYRVTAGSIHAHEQPNEAEYRRSAISRVVYAHEGYRAYGLYGVKYDISLLFLDTPIEYNDRVQPAILSHKNRDAREGWNCRYSGWGTCREEQINLEDGKSETVPIRAGTLKVGEESSIIHNKHCIKNLGFNKKGYKNMFCYADLRYDNPDQCQSSGQGDSGGPVACRESKDKQFGNVVHGVISCGCTQFWRSGHISAPDTAVKPSLFINWIEEKVRSKTKNSIIKQEGSDAIVGSAPYHVSISGKYSNRNDMIIICQGSILSKRWILTAASCVDNDPFQHTKGPQRGELDLGEDPQELLRVVVKAGLDNEDNVQFEPTDEWYQHDLYKKINDKYDKHNIALIFLKADLNFETEYVKPIRLITAKRATKCKVFGWEYNYETESRFYENPLQVRKVKVIDDKKCSSPMLKPRAMKSFLGYQICTKQEYGKPTISVEAGTSLICKHPILRHKGVFGVASFGGYWERVGGGAGPKVFTRIEPNLEWITSKQAEIENVIVNKFNK